MTGFIQITETSEYHSPVVYTIAIKYITRIWCNAERNYYAMDYISHTNKGDSLELNKAQYEIILRILCETQTVHMA